MMLVVMSLFMGVGIECGYGMRRSQSGSYSVKPWKSLLKSMDAGDFIERFLAEVGHRCSICGETYDEK